VVKSEEEKKQYKRDWYLKNKDKLAARSRERWSNATLEEKQYKLERIKQWQAENPDKRKATVDKYHKQHQNEDKHYYQENKDRIKNRIKNYVKNNKDKINAKQAERRKDPIVKLRHRVSVLIRHYICGVKNGSIMKYLPYSIAELKGHLESQFETWMTWNNWGVYDAKSWNDEDSSTWTWQIDHIIPQSELPYSSMAEDNFKKCWSLDNLRPLSSKQNIINGTQLARKKNAMEANRSSG
jgi:hypothetical protein